jgi:hypothetical protein
MKYILIAQVDISVSWSNGLCRLLSAGGEGMVGAA